MTNYNNDDYININKNNKLITIIYQIKTISNCVMLGELQK